MNQAISRKPSDRRKDRGEAPSRMAVFSGLRLLLLAGLAFFMASCAVSGPARTTDFAEEITVSQAYEAYMEGVLLLDVRTQAEWVELRVPGSTWIPLDELEARQAELPRGEPIMVLCRSGNRSRVGRDLLLQAGFEEVTSVGGGINGWERAGYPVESGDG
jgi:rhodanese-related sulfurtransferase